LGLPQISEVTRHGWLGQLKDFDEITHTNLAINEQVENSESRSIGKRAKHHVHMVPDIDLGHGHSLIEE